MIKKKQLKFQKHIKNVLKKLEGFYASYKPHTFYKCGTRKRIDKKIQK